MPPIFRGASMLKFFGISNGLSKLASTFAFSEWHWGSSEAYWWNTVENCPVIFWEYDIHV